MISAFLVPAKKMAPVLISMCHLVATLHPIMMPTLLPTALLLLPKMLLLLPRTPMLLPRTPMLLPRTPLLLPRTPLRKKNLRLQKMHLSKLTMLPSRKSLNRTFLICSKLSILLSKKIIITTTFLRFKATDSSLSLVIASLPVDTFLLQDLPVVLSALAARTVIALAKELAAQALQFIDSLAVPVPGEMASCQSLALPAQTLTFDHLLVLALAPAVLVTVLKVDVMELLVHNLVHDSVKVSDLKSTLVVDLMLAIASI